MKAILYNYRCGKEIIPVDIIDGMINTIESSNNDLKKYEIKNFKDILSSQLNSLGWSNPIRLSSKSQIKITSMQRKIGLCTQTGNVARMYADILKLQAMYMDEKISAAIFVLPTNHCARSFGGNIAFYDRLLNELTNIFSKVITVPMLVIGFDNLED